MGRYRHPDTDPRGDAFNRDRHPLGKRAHKLSEGILVVRFELPFSIWCNACEGILIQGTRYNAEKRRVGEYYSTPLWAFRAKCRHCSATFEIQTDPKNTTYIVTEGARKKVEEWDPEEEGNGAAVVDLSRGPDTSVAGSSLAADPFAKLDKETSQRALNSARTKRILELEDHATRRWSDPYSLNARLRKSFRTEKKVEQAKRHEESQFREQLGWREDAPLLSLRANDDQHKEVDQAEWKRLREERERRELQEGRLPVQASNMTTSGRAKSASSSHPHRDTAVRAGKARSTVSHMNPVAQRLAAKVIWR